LVFTAFPLALEGRSFNLVSSGERVSSFEMELDIIIATVVVVIVTKNTPAIRRD
jgi:hypothetical protein